MRFLKLIMLAFFVLEIVLLIKIGGRIGVLATIVWLFAAVFIGVNLLRIQGVVTLTEVRAMMARGEAPTAALANGFVMAIAGMLFILPGFASDALALLCLMPGLRQMLIRRWAPTTGARGTHPSGNVYDVEDFAEVKPAQPKHISSSLGQTLDGEFKHEDE